jgi:hypothetical protein
MTERKPPDDRELEQYLQGDSPLSRRYHDASGEASPPELDEAILAQARAELKRKPPSLNRYLAPVALAASLVLGVNLAWNLYEIESVPAGSQRFEERLEKSAAPAQAPDPVPVPQQAPAPEAAPEARRRAPAAPPVRLEDSRPGEADTGAAAREREPRLAAETQAKDQAAAEARSEERAAAARQAYAESQQRQSRDAAEAAAPSAALAAPEPAPLTQAQKIDRMIGHIRGLEGAVFIRNGKEYTAAEAAEHMQLKRGKAGDRCDTADEFIRTCASFSSMSGEAYLIRFPDGRTRTAEDVLREELAAMP